MKCSREIYMQKRRCRLAQKGSEHALCIAILTIAFLSGLYLLSL
jgi:hypothetical protein